MFIKMIQNILPFTINGGSFFRSFPRAFSLSVFREGEWSKIYQTTDNREKDFLPSFKTPIGVSMVRVDIQKTDDKIVALTAVMPIKSRDDKVPSMSFPPEVSLATLAPGFRRQPGR